MEPIIKELIKKGIIEKNVLDFRLFNGGTSSQIGYLQMENGEKIVVKSNTPKVIEAEIYLLNYYQDVSLFPGIIYADPAFRYILYTYMEGEMYVDFQRKAILKDLVQKVINHYKPAEIHNIWGLMEEPVGSWQDFLLAEVEVAGERLSSILSKEDYRLIISFVMSSNRNGLDTPYLLHGDCGVHNFLFENSHLSGVIDPTPIIGMPIYDLVFAFCSSPIDLSWETITEAAQELKFPIVEENLIEEVIIGLYIRISRCVAHHPNDLPMYLKAWGEWKEILKRKGGTC